jgi:hypothetical protein
MKKNEVRYNNYIKHRNTDVAVVVVLVFQALIEVYQTDVFQ